MSSPWKLSEVWNASFTPREARDKTSIWATDLGKAPVDVFLAWKGVEPSNPPNPRALRKFEAGNLTEWVVEQVLKRAGILQDAQVYLTLERGLPITGRLDFVAGGTPQEPADLSDLPEFFAAKARAVYESLKDKKLDHVPIEVKSVSSFVFDSGNLPIEGHRLQLAHYLVAGDYQYGVLVYICKDDLRMAEFYIPRKSVEEDYEAAVRRVVTPIVEDKQPDPEPLIVFENGKFNENYRVKYSAYLTHLYGFKVAEDYEQEVRPKIQRWNRVLKRIADGKDMTDDNKAALQEMRDAGFNLEEYGV